MIFKVLLPRESRCKDGIKLSRHLELSCPLKLCGLYLSLAQQVRKFCASVTNGREEPVEPSERQIMSLTRCVVRVSIERHEAPSHTDSSGFFELCKTQVPKAQDSGTIHRN
jgi:hypothetical protein